jgi:type II secretory pathway component PulC
MAPRALRSGLPLDLRTFVAACVVGSFAYACGGESTREPKTANEAASSNVSSASSPEKPITSLKRSAVKSAIARGLGAFLRNVTVEDWPVMHNGKFYGFKIRTINSDWGVDLKPGDVVTRVNGIVPEHPEEADAALRSLEKAASLKVDFERDGKAKTLELPIVD